MKEIDYDNIELDEEEQWIEDHLDEFEPAPGWVGKSLREAASKPPIIVKSEKPNKKVITLRLIDKDLKALKAKANEEGLPYQTMITSIIHKYLNGILVDINEARKVIKF